MTMRWREARVMLVAIIFFVGFGSNQVVSSTQSDPPGEYVTVQPIVGTSARPIRVYLTTVEKRVIRKLEQVTALVVNKPARNDALIRWYIEPSARLSPTMLLQRRILTSVQEMLEGADGVTAGWPVSIVIGRSQDFILSTLEKLDCRPNLDSQGGQILMGAAVCGRRVIVSNLSGYLFLSRPDQGVTPEMESLPELPLFKTPFKIVFRNASALAHEWMHIFRAAGLDGRIAPDEPAWYREGFAEMWAYIAKIREFDRTDGFLRMHVTRLRDFSNWARDCPGPLVRYRTGSSPNGCEYYLGALATEYLIATYGGLDKVLKAFKAGESKPSFAEGFQSLYGVSLVQFEAEADQYIETIRAAERRS